MAFARAARLKRGINLSMWYAQSSDYSAARLASYTTADDFRLIKSLGFDHVRLSIDPEPLLLEKQSGALRPEAIARLDHTLQQITAEGLAVVLDIHPEEGWKKEISATEDGTTRFLNFWRVFAHHYATTNPELVYLEVLNEPNGVNVYLWAGIQARAVAVIRSQAPAHTIVATGAGWGKLDALVATEPVRDPNVIYTFHMYDPFEFTHQGANWTSLDKVYLRGVPYPSSPEAVAPLLATEPDEVARVGLARYGLERWDGRRVAGEIALANDWARSRHVPLWCGEFGAYRAYAPAAARDHWLEDARRGFETAGIGWSMWDYQGSFALVTKANGVTTPDAGVLRALGMTR